MLVTEFRAHLLKERTEGKRPEIVIMSEKDFQELLGDLTIKSEVFDPVILHGVRVVSTSMVSFIGDQSLQTQPAGPQ